MSGVNPGDLLTWVALAVAVVIGARGGIQRSTIAALREQNDAYENREKKHQEDLERLQEERSKKDGQTDAALRRLGERNSYLEELVLRRAEGQELVDVMREHDSEAAKRHAATIRTLRDIVSAQRDRSQVEVDLVQAIGQLTTKLEGADGG